MPPTSRSQAPVKPRPLRRASRPEPEELTVDQLGDDTRWTALSLSGAVLADVRARGVDFDESLLSDCDLSGARLTRLGLLDTELVGCNLANLVAPESTMLRSRLCKSRMTGLAWADGTVRDVLFAQCTIALSSFRFCKFQRVSFESCVLREADFHEAQLESVRFLDCDLTGASFSGAQMQRSEIHSCEVQGLRGIDGLRGVGMRWSEIIGLAGPMASALGIRVLDETGDSAGMSTSS